MYNDIETKKYRPKYDLGLNGLNFRQCRLRSVKFVELACSILPKKNGAMMVLPICFTSIGYDK